MARLERFELPTHEVEARCSNPLSYSRQWCPSPDSNGEHTPFERAASTNCARGALFGVSYRYRSGTTAFTEQGAGHYTKDTINNSMITVEDAMNQLYERFQGTTYKASAYWTTAREFKPSYTSLQFKKEFQIVKPKEEFKPFEIPQIGTRTRDRT